MENNITPKVPEPLTAEQSDKARDDIHWYLKNALIDGIEKKMPNCSPDEWLRILLDAMRNIAFTYIILPYVEKYFREEGELRRRALLAITNNFIMDIKWDRENRYLNGSANDCVISEE